jgi:hypothetical protein
MKIFTSLLLASSILFTPMTSYADATVFGRYMETDNGDSCQTPEEIHAIVLADQSSEIVKSWDNPDDVLKIKLAVVKRYPDVKLEDMIFTSMEVYANPVAPTEYTIVLYVAGCMWNFFQQERADYDLLMTEAFGKLPDGLNTTEPKVLDPITRALLENAPAREGVTHKMDNDWSVN